MNVIVGIKYSVNDIIAQDKRATSEAAVRTAEPTLQVFMFLVFNFENRIFV